MQVSKKVIGLLLLALAVTACAKDNQKREPLAARGEEKLVDDSGEALLEKASMEVTSGTALGVGSNLFSIVVSLPVEGGEESEEYSTTITGNEQADFRGRQMFSTQKSEIDPLVLIQSLGAGLDAVIVTRYASEDLVEGVSYVFGKDSDKKMQLMVEAELGENYTQEDVIAQIRDYQSRMEGLSTSQALVGMLSEGIEFKAIDVIDESDSEAAAVDGDEQNEASLEGATDLESEVEVDAEIELQVETQDEV